MLRLATLVRTIYPATCAACDEPLSGPAGFCLPCSESLEVIEASCPTCARPSPVPVSMPCISCERFPSALTSVTACFEYGGQLAVALRRLKFSGRSDIGRSLQPLLSDAFASVAARCDLAIPIPLHPRRLRSRGYNQAMRILAPLARHAGLGVNRRALQRTRATSAQSTLSRAKRTANLRGALIARKQLGGARILLLDDIRTTGATLEEAAVALRRAGADEIHGFVVARTEWEG